MREILFRGKRVNSGEWVYGSLIVFDEDQMFIMPQYNYASTLTYTELFKLLAKPVIPETVGQYTGLTDRNGTKIFEGDIIEGVCHSACSHRNQRCVVEWNESKAKFECRNYIGRPLESDYYSYAVKFSRTVEVIGNIHDSLELLKGG